MFAALSNYFTQNKNYEKIKINVCPFGDKPFAVCTGVGS